MRIHSDVISFNDIHRATRARGMSGVYADVTPKGSRKRHHAFEISMTGNSPYAPNNRNYYSGQKAAQWDEWGIVIAELFALDPKAIIGQYPDKETFERITGGRFDDLQASETHRRHKWEPNGDYTADCACGAHMDWTHQKV